MIKYSIATMAVCFISLQSFSQQEKKELSQEETKKIMSSIDIDTLKMLKDYGLKACTCIDSIEMDIKDDKEKANAIGECVNKQTVGYQINRELNNSLKTSDKNITINVDKQSNQYKTYYFELEEWLFENCSSLKKGISANNKESSLSVSTNKKALEEYDKGIDFVKEENYKDALPWFKKAVKTDPNFPFAWDNIGYCSRKLEKYDEALEAYYKSLSIDPKGKMPLQNIPVVYQFKENYDKAIIAYNKLLEVFPEDPEGYFGIGRMYILKSDLEKGLDNMCKAYNLYVKINSPYRVDAQTIIQEAYQLMKVKGQEELFNKILKDNNISTK